MSLIPTFLEYADAFEKAYETDNWSLVAPYFSEDAVYDPGTERFAEVQSGREAILEYFKHILDAFDRRFASRELEVIEGPVEEGDSIWIRGAAIYGSPDVPELRLVLKETLVYRDGLIVSLRDEFTREMNEELGDYVERYRENLDLDL